MSKIFWAIVVIVLIVGGWLVLGRKDATPAVTQNQQDKKTEASVALTSSGFEPKSLTIKAGAKVTWTNQSGSVATVNSAPHPTHTDYLPLNLGQFEDGQSVSLVFDKPGTYRYHDHLNATRFGSVIVE